MALDNYLIRLQAKRAALNTQALDAPATQPPPRVCPRCYTTVPSKEAMTTCKHCYSRVAPLSIVTAVQVLDDLIAWTKQAQGWRQTA